MESKISKYCPLPLIPFRGINCSDAAGREFSYAKLNYFILEPKKSVYEAMILGLVIYGVYETTNYAILKNWKLTTVILDGLWGSILFGLTTYFTYLLRFRK